MLRGAIVSAAISALALAGCGASTPPAATAPRAISAALEPFAQGSPIAIEIPAPPAVRRAGGWLLEEFRIGRAATLQSGCLACHKIGAAGNRGPGPNLTHVGSKLPRARIERALLRPTEPMPSFSRLPRWKFHAIVIFLSELRR